MTTYLTITTRDAFGNADIQSLFSECRADLDFIWAFKLDIARITTQAEAGRLHQLSNESIYRMLECEANQTLSYSLLAQIRAWVETSKPSPNYDHPQLRLFDSEDAGTLRRLLKAMGLNDSLKLYNDRDLEDQQDEESTWIQVCQEIEMPEHILSRRKVLVQLLTLPPVFVNEDLRNQLAEIAHEDGDWARTLASSIVILAMHDRPRYIIKKWRIFKNTTVLDHITQDEENFQHKGVCDVLRLLVELSDPDFDMNDLMPLDDNSIAEFLSVIRRSFGLTGASEKYTGQELMQIFHLQLDKELGILDYDDYLHFLQPDQRHELHLIKNLIKHRRISNWLKDKEDNPAGEDLMWIASTDEDNSDRGRDADDGNMYYDDETIDTEEKSVIPMTNISGESTHDGTDTDDGGHEVRNDEGSGEASKDGQSGNGEGEEQTGDSDNDGSDGDHRLHLPKRRKI